MHKVTFNYGKLRGRIIEKCGSIESFAKALEITPTTIGRKLSEKSEWSQREIINACKILDIPSAEIATYFFTNKVEIY